MKAKKFFIKYFEIIRVVTAIVIGFLLALVAVYFISDNPVESIKTFMFGPFTNVRRFSNIIEFWIPLVFTALAMCMMMKVGEFNMIGEGSFHICAAFTTYFAACIIPESTPKIVFIPLLLIISAIIGGLLAMIPAALKIKWNTNIVVVSIMLNYAVTYFGTYMLRYWMRDRKVTYLGSMKIADNAKLSSLIRGTKLHTGIFFAIAAVIIVYIFLYKTKWGYEIRLTGSNRSFSKYSGIKSITAMIVSQLIGGALAGMGGCIEILGRYDRFLWETQTGYGTDGMMIAVLAGGNPALVPLTSFLISYIKAGANVTNAATDIPSEFIKVIQAIIIILVAASLFMQSIKNRLVVEVSKEEELAKGDNA